MENLKQKSITSDFIEKLSYTDFVGFINQWNVLPGSYTTLSKWIAFSRINKNSRILEIACTTGFSSREIATLTGCNGEGFDLSKSSIEMADFNRRKYAPDVDFSYKVADGYNYKPKSKFTHIIIGASLQFFPDPDKMLDLCINMLKDGGYMLASPFYVTRPIPNNLIKRAQSVFGITPTDIPYKQIMRSYNKLEIIYEDHNELISETEEELNYYCKSTIDGASKIRNIKDQKVYGAMYERLFEVKKMSNDLRPYQKYSVLVLRYRKSVYPNRFVELF
jgi:SAM-dependent methyltransferase